MREIVIVIADLYLPLDAAGSPPAASSSSSPGLQHLVRFGQRHRLDEEAGWRPWLARWLGRDDLASLAPAPVASAASGTPSFNSSSPGSTVWLATPVHRLAGLTSVHLDRRSLLQLSSPEVQDLVNDFNRAFGDDPASRLRLQGLPSGALLLEGPANLNAVTTEPARALVIGLEGSLPRGPKAAPLKRLSAEIEMWLHAHPINTARVSRGEVPVNGLWLWGGGASASLPPSTAPATAARSSSVRLFGADPYLNGLSHLSGAPLSALPGLLHDVPELAAARRTVLVTEVTPELHANPSCTLLDAIAAIDHRFIAPALALLHGGAIEQITVVANDIEVRVRRHDRLKFWRRRRSILGALQPDTIANA